MRGITPIRASEIQIEDAHYVPETVRSIWEELPRMLAGAILVDLALIAFSWTLAAGAVPLACGLLVAIVVPSWSAYAHIVARNLVGFKPDLGSMLRAVPHFYCRSVLLGLPLALFLMALLLLRSNLNAEFSVTTIAMVTMLIVSGALLAALLMYGVAMLAAFDLTLREAWSYSFALVIRWPPVAIGLLSMAFLLMLAAKAIGIGAWIALPALLTPFQVSATLVLAKRVIIAQRGENN